MGYDYYESPKDKIMAHMEGIVPLILIIVVGLLVAINLNIINISGLPFAKQQINVLVIGTPTDATVEALRSFDAKGMNVSMTTLSNVNSILPGTLAGFDTIILQGNKFLSRTARTEVLKFVNKGGKLILVQNAATRVEGDESILGWDYVFGDLMPVTCAAFVQPESGSCKTISTIQGKFLPAGQSAHPILQGVKVYPQTGYTTWQVLDITPLETPIAYIQGADDSLYPAIVIKESIFGGKVIYFNYDPGMENMTGVFLNTLQWLNA